MRYIILTLAVVALFGCNSDKQTHVLIETNMGNIEVALYNETPIHKENFIKLVEEGYYDGLLFHRVMDKFMIQAGDPDSKDARPGERLGMGGPGYTLEAEIGAPHLRGALAAARTGGPANPEKRSSGSQFYIVQGRKISPQELDAFENRLGIQYNETQRKIYMEEGGTPQLDMEYTVFGEVVDGMDVVDKIAMTNTDSYDRPVQDVRIQKVTIVK
jgi:peptidyl-prolyl cis-trans isomerase B (cyclophilin B)